MENREFGQDQDGADEDGADSALRDAGQRAEASRRRLEEIQALTRVGSWEWDLASERPSWSEGLRRIAGLAPGEPVPGFDEFIDQIHPEDRAGFLASMERSLDQASVRHYTYRVVMPDGAIKVIESHAQVETDDGGTPVRVYGAAQDITDRHRAEASLHLQADLLDQIEVAVMASSVDRRLTQWNRAAERLLGVSRKQALESTIDQILRIPPEAQKQREAMVLRLAAGEKWEGELLLYDAEEGTFPAYATNAPVRDSDGQIVGYSGVIVDLSETKRAHAELQRRAEEQATIAALSRAAMSSDDVDALLAQAATATTEILGVEFAEVFELKADGQGLLLRASAGHDGAPVGEETTVDDGSQAAYTLSASGPVVVEDYAREQRFTPSPRQAQARRGATVVIEGGDQAYGVLGAYTAGERSFSVDSIQFLQSVANVLAAAIASQRAQRLESQLHQSQRLEAVGQLAGGVAHDFNNLLVVILNYAEFLLDRIEDEDLRGDVGEIKTAAERAAGLTHQLLVFSRREVVMPEAVDLNEVVVETEGLLRHTLREHIELVHSHAESLWKVRLGSGQAEQILVNLLVNARDAMPAGGVVDVKTENLELGPGHGKRESLAEGRYVRLTVADSGVGMTDDVAAQVFDPFFTTRKDDGGTGLGLATVYGIVKEAGGTVEIYTEPGHGSAFKVYLPAIVDEAAAVAGGDPRWTVPASGQTILLVEDEEKVRRLAERILAENGYRVLTAADGQGALEFAKSHGGPIDLLLTDVVMPRLSGPQLAQELRALRPQLRALFMSGYTGEVISRHGAVEEGVALIEKPFDAKGLLHAVSNVLHAAPAETDAG
jgi:PAS domain S-box-containing protein